MMSAKMSCSAVVPLVLTVLDIIVVPGCVFLAENQRPVAMAVVTRGTERLPVVIVEGTVTVTGRRG